MRRFDNARSYLDEALIQNRMTVRAKHGQDALTSLRSTLDTDGAKLGQALTLLRQLRADAGDAAPSPREMLARVLAYVDFAAPLPEEGSFQWFAPPPLVRPSQPPRGSAESIEAFRGGLVEPPSQELAPAALEEKLWSDWRDRIVAYFRSGEPRIGQFGYADLLLAALGRAPASLFRANLSTMGVTGWSRLGLAALATPPNGPVAPAWAFVASLRALGFGPDYLRTAAQCPFLRTATPGDVEVIVQISSIPQPASRPGLLLIVPEGTQLPEIPKARPTIAVGAGEANLYIEALEWFAQTGALEGVANVE